MSRWLIRIVLVNSLSIIVLAVLVVIAFNTINNSRRDVLLRSCQEQNIRHDKTVKALDMRIALIPSNADRAEAEARRDATVALIDALQPVRDCEQRADTLTR